MKKILALLLALIMVLGMLAGCSDKDDISGEITPIDEEEEVVHQDEEPEEETEAPEEETEAPVEETEAPTEETEAPTEENTVSLGRLEGGVYTNTYAGFGCELDENWVYYSAEELQVLPENTQELFEGTEMGELSAEYTQISDMMAENTTDMTSMNVLYTQIGLQERLAYLSLTEEETIDATLAQSDMMIEAYEQAGYENVAMEKVKVTFLGEEHTALKTTATLQGYDYYVLQIMDYKCGSYGVTLTVSCFFEDTTEDILALFYKV